MINKKGYISPKKAKKEKSAGLIYADKYPNIMKRAPIILRIINVFLTNLAKSFSFWFTILFVQINPHSIRCHSLSEDTEGFDKEKIFLRKRECLKLKH